MKPLVSPLIAVGLAFFLIGCADDPPPTTASQTGFVSVQVIDISSNQPVANVEIMIAGTELVAETDEKGIAVFEIAAGDYFVDARTCCIGPGWIEHHVAVVVEAGRTVEVTLSACLACV